MLKMFQNEPLVDIPMYTIQVTPGSGSYQSIQQAIDSASPNTRIQVSSCLYTQPIIINKPGLILESLDPDSEVQITCSSGPIIHIILSQNDFCKIKGFKLIHTAIIKKQEMFTHLAGETELENCESLRNSEHWIKSIRLNRSTNSAIWIESGTVFIEECHITLSSAKSSLPGIIINKSSVLIDNCEIKGQGEVPTVGIYAIESNLNIFRSKIYKHRSGGIIVNSSPKNDVLISECEIVGNVNCGVYFIGEDAQPVIQRSKIAHNEDGIKVASYNCARIKGCEIKQNEKGINVENADPFIFLNIIRENREEGVYFHSEVDGRCDGKLMSNDLYENDNAVVCSGSNCFPVIKGNGKISKNKKAGIKVVDGAHACIVKNEIFENTTQGILLVKGSSAHIESNMIYYNEKANIAFGGDENSDTTIVYNAIFRGKAEGIFNLEGGTSWIFKNKIFENSDGIVLIDSHPIISHNNINENRRSGITVAGKSQPNISNNEIVQNTAVGINVRDRATGLMKNNFISKNLVQVALITRSNMNLKEIRNENEIVGEIQIPLPAICSVF